MKVQFGIGLDTGSIYWSTDIPRGESLIDIPDTKAYLLEDWEDVFEYIHATCGDRHQAHDALCKCIFALLNRKELHPSVCANMAYWFVTQTFHQ